MTQEMYSKNPMPVEVRFGPLYQQLGGHNAAQVAYMGTALDRHSRHPAGQKFEAPIPALEPADPPPALPSEGSKYPDSILVHLGPPNIFV